MKNIDRVVRSPPLPPPPSLPILSPTAIIEGQYILPLQIELRKNHQFTGRTILLQRLHNDLRPGNATINPVPVVLYGLGGIGKTQVAREFIDRYQKEYDAVHWFHGDNPEALIKGFYNLARKIIIKYEKLDIQDGVYRHLSSILQMPEDSLYNIRQNPQGKAALLIEAVLMWLDADDNRKWLLIYDNVDDLSFPLENFLPRGDHGNIIITSRRSTLAQRWIPLEVEQMSKNESLQLLRALSHLDIMPDTKG